MAGEGFAVRATPAAASAVDGLRGKARKRYDAFERELRKQGCKVAGYRLLALAGDGYSEHCCKRLVENWRVITTFEPGVAIIVAVGRHEERGFYLSLAKTLEIAGVGQGRGDKPACCGEDGWPSVGKARGERRKHKDAPRLRVPRLKRT
jgi:hypothetical protein